MSALDGYRAAVLAAALDRYDHLAADKAALPWWALARRWALGRAMWEQLALAANARRGVLP